MPLNWNIEKVDDYKELTDRERSVLDALTWAVMGIGMRGITAKNVDEFYARLHLMEKLRGTFFTKDGKKDYIKKEEVERLIGLTTNAGEFSRAKFNANILKHYYADYIEEKKHETA